MEFKEEHLSGLSIMVSSFLPEDAVNIASVLFDKNISDFVFLPGFRSRGYNKFHLVFSFQYSHSESFRV
jgi:hypothetical protein